MKVRLGYVSNSSSSSFVMIGIQIPKEKEDEICKKFAEILKGEKLTGDNEIYDILSSSDDYLSDDGPGYIGKVIADISSEDGYMETTIVEFQEAIEEAYKILRPLGFKKEDIKLITGTRSC